MSKDIEAKLDKLIEGQNELAVGQAVLVTKMESKDQRLKELEADVKGLNRFKWGIIGTAAVSVSTFIKSMFA